VDIKVARVFPANIPKQGKTYQITINITNGPEMFQMTVYYTKWSQKISKSFHSKVLQNILNWDFWVENIQSGKPGSHAHGTEKKVHLSRRTESSRNLKDFNPLKKTELLPNILEGSLKPTFEYDLKLTSIILLSEL
jgi:hypothetical protein